MSATTHKNGKEKPDEFVRIKLPMPVIVHKTINWAVSFFLVGFAIWSMTLNAGIKTGVTQALQTYEAIEKETSKLTEQMELVKDACLKQATIVIPTAPVEIK